MRKTILAQKLARKLELPLVHIDALYRRDNWKNASKDEFDELLMKEFVKQKWIIGGNINR